MVNRSTDTTESKILVPILVLILVPILVLMLVLGARSGLAVF